MCEISVGWDFPGRRLLVDRGDLRVVHPVVVAADGALENNIEVDLVDWGERPPVHVRRGYWERLRGDPVFARFVGLHEAHHVHSPWFFWVSRVIEKFSLGVLDDLPRVAPGDGAGKLLVAGAGWPNFSVDTFINSHLIEAHGVPPSVVDREVGYSHLNTRMGDPGVTRFSRVWRYGWRVSQVVHRVPVLRALVLVLACVVPPVVAGCVLALRRVLSRLFEYFLRLYAFNRFLVGGAIGAIGRREWVSVLKHVFNILRSPVSIVFEKQIQKILGEIEER